jgi:hypothetical protein
MSEPVRRFGPFLAIPCADIRLAGWRCQRCRRQVEVLAIVVPALAPRMIFNACKCGCVVTWEDETPCCPETWPSSTRLLKKYRVGVLIYNGDRPLGPQFSGVN